MPGRCLSVWVGGGGGGTRGRRVSRFALLVFDWMMSAACLSVSSTGLDLFAAETCAWDGSSIIQPYHVFLLNVVGECALHGTITCL